MRRHPDWLKVKIPGGENYKKVISLLNKSKLHTVCQEAKCPNIAECFGCGTATFLIMGDTCTRDCRYCNVKHGKPLPLDLEEPKNIAESVKELGLKYVVITSVTRDDLEDGGAMHFSKTVSEIKKQNPETKVEILVPDFKGDEKAMKTIVISNVEVVAHNIEVVKELFQSIRPQGNYKLSLKLLREIKQKIKNKNHHQKNKKTKSGFMIGLGETKEQIIETMKDLRDAGVDILTIGQYLQPRKDLAEIKKYYTPEEFKEFKNIAIQLGFKDVQSAPLVRSSYHAEESFK